MQKRVADPSFQIEMPQVYCVFFFGLGCFRLQTFPTCTLLFLYSCVCRLSPCIKEYQANPHYGPNILLQNAAFLLCRLSWEGEERDRPFMY